MPKSPSLGEDCIFDQWSLSQLSLVSSLCQFSTILRLLWDVIYQTAQTYWTVTINTHLSLYVTDNGNWMSCSGFDGFWVCICLCVCVSAFDLVITAHSAVFTCVYLFACARQASCNTLISQHPCLTSLAASCILPHTYWDLGRLFTQCNTLE